MRLIGLVLAALAGCGPAASPGAVEPEPALREPRVEMRADPPPPYTYWAPEGSVIVNHPNGDPVWIAQNRAGERLVYYFGDACEAAERQAWIGRNRADLPELQRGPRLRIIEPDPDMVVTSDLIYARLNVALDAQGNVTDVSCG